MPASPSLAQTDKFQDLSFPTAGIDLSSGFQRQLPKQMLNQLWGRTCRAGLNVRGFDAGSQRFRGGSRPGLVKYIPAAVIAGWILQDLNVLVETSTPPGSIMAQISQSGRVVTLVTVSQGQVFYANSGDIVWTQATNNTGLNPPLNYTGIIYSSALNQKLWFADGINWCYFNPNDGTVNTWAPSGGALPVDDKNNTPRLIATWRGRIVLSGLIDDPQDWFMSKVNDATNFDYSPLSPSPAQAIAGNNAPTGFVGDVLTALVPYTDDVLYMGGDHSIYRFSGDPMAGGQIDLVSSDIGMAWGKAFCKDPYGNLYFMSNKTGIYMIEPGSAPQRISQPIEQLVNNIDTGANNIVFLWNDRFQGLHVFITALAGPAVTTHLFWEQRTGAWWQDSFANTNLDPLVVVTFDGNTPGDRHPLIGSWDGYVRAISPTATDDDGTAIASSVVLGPINTADLDDMLLKDLQTVLGETSGAVTYQVFVGTTAEAALTGPARAAGTWSSGRGFTNLVRAAGKAVYVKISASNPWAMEQIRARIATEGKVRRRTKY